MMIPAVLCQGLAHARCCPRVAKMLMVVLELSEPFPPCGQGNSTDLSGLPQGVKLSLAQDLVGCIAF